MLLHIEAFLPNTSLTAYAAYIVRKSLMRASDWYKDVYMIKEGIIRVLALSNIIERNLSIPNPSSLWSNSLWTKSYDGPKSACAQSGLIYETIAGKLLWLLVQNHQESRWDFTCSRLKDILHVSCISISYLLLPLLDWREQITAWFDNLSFLWGPW